MLFGLENTAPIVVLTPHPDDETLGAGGFLLRARAAGHPIHWLIVTAMRPQDGWPEEKMQRRQREIAAVAAAYGFASVTELGFAAAQLDTVAIGDLVGAISKAVLAIQPQILLVPHRGDAHSDHAAVHDAGTACAKWFRYPSVRWTLVYETLSETDAAVRQAEAFTPDIFVDIAGHLERKLEILALFGDEIQPFPFPRSEVAVRAQAQLRGAACGSAAAEAFMLLRARI
jgi:N-acetylglucosamine malate deacetylase 1